MVKGRRATLRIKRIQNKEGEWMEQQEDIAKATEKFYKK